MRSALAAGLVSAIRAPVSVAVLRAGSSWAGRVGVTVNSRTVLRFSRAETEDEVRPTVSVSDVALTLRRPDLKRNAPTSSSFADEVTVALPTRSVPDESVSGFSARLPAAESSIVASDGAGVACALGTAASSATAKARTKRDSDIRSKSDRRGRKRTLTHRLRVA